MRRLSSGAMIKTDNLKRKGEAAMLFGVLAAVFYLRAG
jgi:hypothetical protein